MKWAPSAGISVVPESTDGANGLTRDRQGRLVACEGNARRVTRNEPDGSVTVMANNYSGRRLNQPNIGRCEKFVLTLQGIADNVSGP